jgi:hypothetical protein
VLNLDTDNVGDLLLEMSDGFSIAVGVETGVFHPPVLVEASLGYSRPVLVPDDESLSPRLAAVGDEQVGFFRIADLDDWRLDDTYGFSLTGTERYLGDFEGDARLELVSFGSDWPGVGIDEVMGDRYELGSWQMMGPVVGPPGTADIEGDGASDLILLSPDRTSIIVVARDPNNRLLSAPLGIYSGGGTGIYTGDVSWNGYTDVVITGTRLAGIPAHSVFRGEESGRPDSIPSFLPSHEDAQEVVIADVTGDFWDDVISSDGDDTLLCFPSFGSGVYRPVVELELPEEIAQMRPLHRGVGESRVAILLEDGTLNLAVFSELGELDDLIEVTDEIVLVVDTRRDRFGTSALLMLTEAGELLRLANLYSDRYEVRELLDIDVELDVLDIAEGDIDGDGHRDIVFVGEAGSYLYPGPFDASSMSHFEELPIVLDEAPGEEVVIGDLNGDGRDEIIISGGGAPPRVFGATDEGFLRRDLPDWHAAGFSPVLADIDGDVDLDLITLEPEFGAIVWWNLP